MTFWITIIQYPNCDGSKVSVVMLGVEGIVWRLDFYIHFFIWGKDPQYMKNTITVCLNIKEKVIDFYWKNLKDLKTSNKIEYITFLCFGLVDFITI